MLFIISNFEHFYNWGTAIDQNKCLEQIKYPIPLYTISLSLTFLISYIILVNIIYKKK